MKGGSEYADGNDPNMFLYIDVDGFASGDYDNRTFAQAETLDPFMLGLAAFLGLGSQILVGLFAGVFVDRYSRKKLLLYGTIIWVTFIFLTSSSEPRF